MPQVEADNWYGLVVAAATPAPVVAKLHAAAVEALRSPEVKEKYLSQGGIAVGNSSEEFTAYVKSEIDRWGKVIATAGSDQVRKARKMVATLAGRAAEPQSPSLGQE
jgi:tripartite-type tricarboxylate transporter receptor subunit TctC